MFSINKSILFFVLSLSVSVASAAEEPTPVRFNTHFPGASLGKIVTISPDAFRCHVVGQYNESGRNRQCTWFYFRLENVRDRQLKIIMTDYVGEYNNRPGAVAMKASIAPVYSEDNETWHHIDTMDWNNETKEATLHLRPKSDVIWIAHVPPYTHEKILRFLRDIDQKSPWARTEIFGRSVEDRPLHKLVITDPNVPGEEKYKFWLMVRQHAWESPTSLIGEGAVKFLVSNDPQAENIRKRCVFHVVPTLDPDGCDAGGVRFNRNGYDTNRHWSRIDLNSKTDWRNMPEICYALKEIHASHRIGRPIDLLLSLHNQETGECLMTSIDDPKTQETVRRFETLLSEKTFYDSKRPEMKIRFSAPEKADTIEALWARFKIPVVIAEFRVERHPKLDRWATCDDFESMGKGLVQSMFESVASETKAGKER